MLSTEVKRLLAEGRHKEAGAQVGREIQARIANDAQPRRGNRRTGGLWRKTEDWRPATPEEFFISGMAKIEFIAGARARDAAIRAEREFWLPRLEMWLSETTDDIIRWSLAAEIRRLRRTLGIKPPIEAIREQTRNRVKAYRKRRHNETGLSGFTPNG